MKLGILAVLSCLLPACTSLHARAYGGLTQATLEGSVGLQSSAGNLPLNQNRVSLDDEAGVDQSEVLPYLRGELGMPIGSVTVSGFAFSETGGGRLAGNHQFGDILPSSLISSRLEFLNVKAAAHFDLVNVGVFRFSPGLGVDIFDLDAQISQVGTSNFERIDNVAFVPMLFGQAEVDLGVVAGTVDVGWIDVDLKDADGSYLDVEALVRVNPLPHFEVFAGYRFINIDAKGTADSRRFSADFDLHGWMVGGGVTF